MDRCFIRNILKKVYVFWVKILVDLIWSLKILSYSSSYISLFFITRETTSVIFWRKQKELKTFYPLKKFEWEGYNINTGFGDSCASPEVGYKELRDFY